MKAKNKRCLSVAALSTLTACCIGASVMSGTAFFVSAEEHTHAFTGGTCACGAVKTEAETAVLTGTSHYPSVAPDMIESSGAASGGKEIGCFDVTGNTATWTFDVTKAEEGVVLSFSMKSFIDTEDMSGFKLTVNEQALAWKAGEKLEATSAAADPYKLYDTEAFAVEAGTLMVKIEIVDGEKATANIDYLILGLTAEEGETPAPTTDPATTKIEAESGTVTGTSQYPDYCASMIESVAGASGGQEIGCFAVNGNTATWTFTLKEAHEEATLSFAMKSYISTADMSGFKLTVNEQALAWKEGEKLEATNAAADPYKLYDTETFAVEAGTLTVKMEIVDSAQATANIDYLVLTLKAKETDPTPITDPDTMKIEAENAVLTGTSHYPSVAPDMIEANGAASGGKELGCFDVTGNTATWTFTLNESHEEATLFFAMRSFIETEDMSGFKVTVNGQEITWAEEEKLSNTSVAVDPYALYKTVKFSAESGDLVVVLEIVDAAKATANIDYVELSFTGSTSGDEGEKEEILDPTQDEHAVKIEAEDGKIEGTSHYPSETEDMIEENEKASGGKEIGCFDVTGNTASWTFIFGADAENVRIYFSARAFINTSTEYFGLYVDDQPVAWYSKSFANTAALYDPYKFYCSEAFSLSAGTHVVKLEVLDASNDRCAVNFDYVMLAGFGDVSVTPVLPDKEAPVIGEITVTGDGVGAEHTIAFEASDNETTAENLLTIVKVYFDYRGENKEELTVTDGKFTPTKNGKYTIVVRVMDEAGYITEKTATVQIGEETSEDPGADGDWDLEIEKEMSPKEIATVIVGGAAAVAVLLTIGKALFGRKKKSGKRGNK